MRAGKGWEPGSPLLCPAEPALVSAGGPVLFSLMVSTCSVGEKPFGLPQHPTADPAREVSPSICAPPLTTNERSLDALLAAPPAEGGGLIGSRGMTPWESKHGTNRTVFSLGINNHGVTACPPCITVRQRLLGDARRLRFVFTNQISGLLRKKQPESSEKDTKHMKAL